MKLKVGMEFDHRDHIDISPFIIITEVTEDTINFKWCFDNSKDYRTIVEAKEYISIGVWILKDIVHKVRLVDRGSYYALEKI